MRGLLRALALAGVLAAAGPAAAVGTILVPGASLRTGSAPSPGRVLLDPAAGPGTPPAAPLPDSLGSLGTPPGPPPAFPGAATGSGGNFAATSPTSLPGGTYDFASFNVGPGGTVEFTGPVVLDVAGNVNVAGSVTTAGPGRSLEIRCGGAFTVFGGDALTTARGVFTTGSASPITVDAAGGFVLGDPLAPTTRASIAAASGAVTVTGHGAAAAFEVGNGVV